MQAEFLTPLLKRSSFTTSLPSHLYILPQLQIFLSLVISSIRDSPTSPVTGLSALTHLTWLMKSFIMSSWDWIRCIIKENLKLADDHTNLNCWSRSTEEEHKGSSLASDDLLTSRTIRNCLPGNGIIVKLSLESCNFLMQWSGISCLPGGHYALWKQHNGSLFLDKENYPQENSTLLIHQKRIYVFSILFISLL